MWLQQIVFASKLISVKNSTLVTKNVFISTLKSANKNNLVTINVVLASEEKSVENGN